MQSPVEASPRRFSGKAPTLRAAAVLVAAVLLASGGCSEPAAVDSPESGSRGAARGSLLGSVPADRLHVVLITIDTLRADRLSCLGSDVETPHLDRLAADGVLFTNASTTVPFTLPAHSSILTGTYPPFHGVRENVGYFLGEQNRTLGEILGAEGWQTAGFVSAFVLDARWGIARGFEHYFDDFDLAAFDDPNLGSVQRPGSETIAAATSWLREREAREEERPFFLWLHLFDPHDPYTPPEPFRSRYAHPYDAEVAYTDALVGGFLDELEALGLLQQSLVVATADHGEGLGDHGEAFHGYFVYDSTVHVPLIVRPPGPGAAGARRSEAVSHVDLVPTILDLVGLEIPASVQGQSLLPLLGQTPDPAVAEERPGVYAESFYPLLHYGWAPLRSLRTASHKLIESPTPELFDLAADPGELRSLEVERSAFGRDMARSLRTLALEIEEGAAVSDSADLDEQTLAQLRALGYLAGPGGESATAYDPDILRTDPKEKIGLHRLLMRAQARVSAGDEERAAQLLREALEEDPALLDAHQLLGNLALAAGRAAEAAGHFTRALALDDRHKPSLFGLASAHRELGRVDDALLGFRRLLDLAGQDSKATLAIADLEMERGQPAAAEAILRRAAQPGAPALLFNRLGEVLALDRRPEEARRAFERALAEKPGLAQPHFNLAVLAEGQGDLHTARGHYEQAIRNAPRHYQALFNLARLVGQLGDSDRERQLLEDTLVANPDFAIGHFFLGKWWMDHGDLTRAEETTRAGLALNADTRLGWFVLADILERRGQRREAAESLARGREHSAG